MEILSMDRIISLVKLVACTQVILVVGLLIFAYLIKVYAYFKTKKNNKIKQEITELLYSFLDKKIEFNLHLILKYKKFNAILIEILHSFDKTIRSDEWLFIRQTMVKIMILPMARKLITSMQWYKRYLACLGFQFLFEKMDNVRIKKRLNDPIALVSINAAALLLASDSQAMIDSVIDYFSSARRVQQSLYVQIISNTQVDITSFIRHRLMREKNEYIKAFCYRTLRELSFSSDVRDLAIVDFESSNIELKLSVLDYWARHDLALSMNIFLSGLKDKRWEVRARSAKILGQLGDERCASLIEPCLEDSVWWVRINAAEALSRLGEKGTFILKKQEKERDPFAYDAAVHALGVRHD